jgi:hypothetical protein
LSTHVTGKEATAERDRWGAFLACMGSPVPQHREPQVPTCDLVLVGCTLSKPHEEEAQEAPENTKDRHQDSLLPFLPPPLSSPLPPIRSFSRQNTPNKALSLPLPPYLSLPLKTQRGN